MHSKSKQPIHITLFVFLVFYIICWQAIRLFTSITWSNALKMYEPPFLPLYIGISGAFWTITGLFMVWSMWRGQRRTRLMVFIASALYASWVWVDRLFLQSQLRANWPFDLVLTIALFIFTTIILLDPRNKTYFERETYERES